MEVKSMLKKIMILLVIGLITISTLCVVAAVGKTTDLHDASGLKVLDNGTLLDTYDSNKPIGNITPIESVDDGEKLLYEYDPELIQDTLSTDPLVTEYNVLDVNDPSHSGIYFMFGHDGDIFLGFVKTENMGNGMLKRITEFGEYNGVMK